MRRLALLIPVLLMACNDSDDPCGAEGYASLVGTNVAAVTLPADLNHRILAPGGIATTDFVPDRLNIETDAEGTITRLYCG
ncbi:I78 family peptidase inhibitor [Jannaschia aquimarina]|nr:I78 family peptidase inhibitor [Jannaschia aquimarina]